MLNNNIPYGKQNLEEDDLQAVIEVLKSDWLTQGPTINKFEKEVAKYHKCKYAVAFSNGTAALHGAYFVSTKTPLGKKHKQIDNHIERWEFITSPITFAATANAGLYCGGTPQFVDMDMNTYCIDINLINDAITENTRVIAPVSYAGYPVDIKAIKQLAKVKENNVCIIHDACHAIGAVRKGAGIADYADMTVLSFHPVKHIATGEGGMVLTNNKDYYDRLMMFRTHGITKEEEFLSVKNSGPWYYEMQELGYNYRLTDIQAALGISQMKKLDRSITERNRIAGIYNNAFNELKWITTPPRIDAAQGLHSYHLYPVCLQKDISRKEFFEYMRYNNIGVQVHYVPVHLHPYYKRNFGFSPNQFKTAESFYDSEVSIPMYYGIKEDELNHVLDTIIKFK